jgi:hypothetical protein
MYTTHRWLNTQVWRTWFEKYWPVILWNHYNWDDRKYDEQYVLNLSHNWSISRNCNISVKHLCCSLTVLQAEWEKVLWYAVTANRLIAAALDYKCIIWSIGEIIIDRKKLKYSDRNPSQCHFVDHKSHTDCPGIKPRLPWCMAGTELPQLWLCTYWEEI